MVFVKHQVQGSENQYEYYYLYESYYEPGMEYPQNFKVGKVGDDVSSLVSNLRDKADSKDIDLDQSDIDHFKIQLNTVEAKAKEEGIEEDELGEFYDEAFSGELEEDEGSDEDSDYPEEYEIFNEIGDVKNWSLESRLTRQDDNYWKNGIIEHDSGDSISVEKSDGKGFNLVYHSGNNNSGSRIVMDGVDKEKAGREAVSFAKDSPEGAGDEPLQGIVAWFKKDKEKSKDDSIGVSKEKAAEILGNKLPEKYSVIQEDEYLEVTSQDYDESLEVAIDEERVNHSPKDYFIYGGIPDKVSESEYEITEIMDESESDMQFKYRKNQKDIDLEDVAERVLDYLEVYENIVEKEDAEENSSKSTNDEEESEDQSSNSEDFEEITDEKRKEVWIEASKDKHFQKFVDMFSVADAEEMTGTIRGNLRSLDDFFDILREYPSEKLSEKSWSVETNSGEVTFQFTKEVDSVRPYPIYVGGDIPEKIATETNYPLTDVKRREQEGALYVRPRSVKDVIEEIESFDYNESELSDSGSAVDSIYDDYYDVVNMTPGDIEDRMDNMNCVNRASGDDAVEHLKRNKFIQKTNKSEWDSKKVPESFANDNATSRKVVDQAERTVSFGARHLGQLENEEITKMEDGCFNARVEGLKNWAIDPLQIKGFSVDVDKTKDSEMSDSSVKYEIENTNTQNRLSSMSDSAVSQERVPDVESSQGFGKDVFKSQFGNVDTEVYVNHDNAKEIETGMDAKSHLKEIGIGDKPQERFMAVYLNGNNEHLGTQIVSMGDEESVAFDEKAIVRTASMINARAVIVAHNHPSGNSEPSDDDLRTVRDLKHDLHDSGIKLLDSMVVGGDRTIDITSMRDTTSIW